MITYRKSQGRVVVTQAEGALVGKLDDFQFDLNTWKIYGYRIKGAGMFSKAGGVPSDKLVKIGRDVVFVVSGADIEWDAPARNAEQGRAWASQYKGTRAMSRRGTALGQVEDFVFDPEVDRVLALFLEGDKVLELNEQVATGPAAVVADSSELAKDLPGTPSEQQSWWARLQK